MIAGQAVNARHLDICQDESKVLMLDQIDCLCAAGGQGNVIACLGQCTMQRETDVSLVVYDQDATL